jgi:hypothetical protein
MKRLIPFTGLILFTAMTLLFASCGDGDKKTTETPTGDATTAPDATASTIVTTPQLMMMVKHKVKDYTTFKTVYDGHDSVRRANGLHSYVLGRGMDDSMMVMVALKADDLEKAKAFSKDAVLKTAMQKAGVVGAPEISFIHVMWQDTVNVGSIPRVMSTFTIKDWDIWKKSFEESKQERIDNGYVDRQYGHDADDNHKISLVTALTDVEKAKAYWASDALKKRREAAGLTTEPQRFIFNIVQRYR